MLASIPVDDDGQILLDEYEKLLSDAHQAGLGHPGLQRAGHGHPVAEMIEMAHRLRRPGARRRRAVGLAHARRRAGARLRLLRLLRPQALWADRHRRRLRQDGAARRHAALAGRRQHDRRRHLRADRLPGAPARFEAGTGNIADAVGLGAAIDYLERLGMREHRPLRARPARSTPPSPAPASPGCASSARRRRRPACCPSSWTATHRGRRRGPRPRGHRRPRRPPLRPADPAPLRRWRPRSGRRWRFYNTSEEIDPLARVLHRLAATSGSPRR